MFTANGREIFPLLPSSTKLMQFKNQTLLTFEANQRTTGRWWRGTLPLLVRCRAVHRLDKTTGRAGCRRGNPSARRGRAARRLVTLTGSLPGRRWWLHTGQMGQPRTGRLRAKGPQRGKVGSSGGLSGQWRSTVASRCLQRRPSSAAWPISPGTASVQNGPKRKAQREMKKPARR
jgi:hypothetical protein